MVYKVNLTIDLDSNILNEEQLYNIIDIFRIDQGRMLEFKEIDDVFKISQRKCVVSEMQLPPMNSSDTSDDFTIKNVNINIKA